MKVYAKSGNRYVVDPEDGGRLAFVMAVLPDGSVEPWPRAYTKEALVRFGSDWVPPTENEEAYALKLLENVPVPETRERKVFDG